MLHIAAEKTFEKHFREIPNLKYYSADLLEPKAMIKMDIMNIPIHDHYFDIIYCSHVLEHVLDDIKALRELHRILSPEGWAVIQIPITAKKTFEDYSVTEPTERQRLFGQSDHVRRYGKDFKYRLERTGFSVSIFNASEISTNDILRINEPYSDTIFLCNKESE
jgi:ubiquinone/menaquinone biosynthesis C-methylase UbiE